MEAKLAENRHKGNRDGWIGCEATHLLIRLREEVDELERSLMYRATSGTRQVVRECADVANFAMMIADVAGRMKPKESK
jgi:hypothetical protein